jgi:carbon storage regulator
MLVLSRQRDETIMIGDEVEVTVVDIRGDKVRLGITAPRSIQVHRKEVYEAIKRENRQASGLKPDDLPDIKKTGPSLGGGRPEEKGERPGDARDDKRTRNGEHESDDPQGPLNR